MISQINQEASEVGCVHEGGKLLGKHDGAPRSFKSQLIQGRKSKRTVSAAVSTRTECMMPSTVIDPSTVLK